MVSWGLFVFFSCNCKGGTNRRKAKSNIILNHKYRNWSWLGIKLHYDNKIYSKWSQLASRVIFKKFVKCNTYTENIELCGSEFSQIKHTGLTWSQVKKKETWLGPLDLPPTPFSHTWHPLQGLPGWKWACQSLTCVRLCDPMDGSLPGSVHGVLQVRILQWVAIPFSRGIFPTQGSSLGLLHRRWILTIWAIREDMG